MQVQKIYQQLVDKIPLKKSEVEATLSIKHQYLGQANPVVQKFCKIESENYTHEGVTMRVALVPGDYDVFVSRKNLYC
jgi:ribosome maturation protein Sdo1